ncbi:unnamed protein product [Linum tenue]|uniref:Uncharacterized protein n=1 Tax=Linum tenue TaxID=586396 RepID=A0AAV0NID7_9ROSI|nr:unnamed protein product [Linum tenue]
MAGINPEVPLHLAQAAIFTGKGFRNAEDYARYLIKFQDRPLCPSISLDPARFNRYDMNIPGLINAVGWSNLPLDQCYSFRPEAVRMFYANMQPCFNTDPPTFTTVVYNYLITVTVDILSYLLGYPVAGAEVLDEGDFQEAGFNEVEAIRLYTRDTGEYHSSQLATGRLPDDLKVLHFFITRVFFPRSHGLNRIYPMDMWILASAKENRPISYPHLMFSHMLHYCDDNYNEELPFAPQITMLLRGLGIDLRYKVARVDLIDTLRAQFVLRKVNAFVGRRRPRVNASGGEGTVVVPAVPLEIDTVDEAVPEEPLAVESSDDGEEGLSIADLEDGLGENDGEISDYLSSPTFEF